MIAITVLLIHRILTYKSLVLMAGTLLLTGAIGVYYLMISPNLINSLMNPTLHARLFLYDTLFFIKIKIILLVMVVYQNLTLNHHMDIDILMRKNRLVLCLMKILVPLVLVISITFFALLINGHIYAFSDFKDGYTINHILFIYFFVFCCYYTALFSVVLTAFKSLYGGIVLFIGFIFSEIIHSFSANESHMQSILGVFFPTISVYKEGFSFSMNYFPSLVFIVALTIMNIALSINERY